MVKEGYCGLCGHCQMDSPDFQEAVAKGRRQSNYYERSDPETCQHLFFV